jgi:hypothetical protein
MSKDLLGSLPTGSSDWDTTRNAVYRLAATQRSIRHHVADQLARDIAEIERASAALCKAEPALEVWTDRPSTEAYKPRSVWLLIGVVWVSTACVTAGAIVAIVALVG